MSWTDALVYISGFAGGFLVCWYWLVRPMAELLGWEERPTRPPTTREWLDEQSVVPARAPVPEEQP